MSLTIFDNLQQVQNTFPVFGQQFSDLDLVNIDQSLAEFKHQPLDAEFVIYDEANNIVAAKREYVNKTVLQDFTEVKAKKILAEYGLDRGKYKIGLTITNPVYGNIFDRFLTIKSISTSRTEIRLQRTDSSFNLNLVTNFFKDARYYPNIQLQLDNGVRVPVVNSTVAPSNTNQLLLKLYSPLPPDIQTKQSVFISQVILETYIDNINLDETIEGEVPDLNDGLDYLLTGDPDFDSLFFSEFGLTGLDFDDLLNTLLAFLSILGLDADELGVDLPTTLPVDFNSLDQAFQNSSIFDASNTELLQSTVSLLNTVLSGSKDLGVDIGGGFDNFVHFSSAEARVYNFRERIKLIESHQASIATAETLTSGTGSTVDFYQQKIDDIIGTFDEFDRYLYYQSGSNPLYTGQDQRVTPWPKSNTSVPYTLQSYTSSIASGWYSDLIGYAKHYDRVNPNALFKTIPILQYEDDRNSQVIPFVNMLGQHYDVLYAYINRLTLLIKRDYNHRNAPGPELLLRLGRNLGTNLASSEFGSRVEDFYNTSGSAVGDSVKEYIAASFNRRLNAAPYIKSRKGTRSGVRAIINSFGIPKSFVDIKEYGGSEISSSVVNTAIDRSFNFLRFSENGQSIATNWQAYDGNSPKTVTFMIDPDQDLNNIAGNKTMLRASGSAGDPLFEFSLTTNVGQKYADINFILSSSLGSAQSASIQDFYALENYPTLISLRRDTTATSASNEDVTYELLASQQRFGKVTLFESASFTISGSTGATQEAFNTFFNSPGQLIVDGGQYNGRLYELRYWNSRLTDRQLKDITLSHNAFGGNPESLYLRHPLKFSFDIATTSSLASYEPLELSGVQNFDSGDDKTVCFTGFDGTDLVADTNTLYIRNPSSTLTANTENKVRIVTSSLNTALSSTTQCDTPSQDIFGEESNQVDITLSVDNYYEESLYNLQGYFDVDDYIGDPRDKTKGIYKELERVLRATEKYFVSFNPNDFLRSLETYDNALTSQVEETLPARTDSRVGFTVGTSYITSAGKEAVKLPRASYDSVPSTLTPSTASVEVEISEQYEGCIKNTTSSIAVNISSNIVGSVNNIKYCPTTSTYGLGVCGSNNYKGVACATTYGYDICRNSSILSCNVTSSRPISYDRLSTGDKRQRYLGMLMEGPGINLPSTTTLDGSPVVTVIRFDQKGKKIE